MDAHATLAFALALGVMIAAAKLGGYLSTRLGQPTVLGEIVSGLVLGPSVLNALHWPVFEGGAHLDVVLEHLAFLGVVFLMFLAGMEVEVEALARAGRPALWTGVLGVLVPVGVAGVVMNALGYSGEAGWFVGLVMAATSVSISAQTLMELGVLRSRVGLALLGAAVVDDVLVILMLSVFQAVVLGEGGGVLMVLGMLARMALVLAGAWVLGVRLVPRLGRLVDRLPISEGLLTFAVVVTMLYAWAAEALGGIASITGAFLAGLVFGRSPWRQHVLQGMHKIAYALLVPLFFVNIGLQTDVRLAFRPDGWAIALTLVGLALVTKVLGCTLGGRLGGLDWRDALRLGTGMTSRGEVGLIVASVGMQFGWVDDTVFAGVVLMVLVTTLLTPVALRALYPRRPTASRAA